MVAVVWGVYDRFRVPPARPGLLSRAIFPISSIWPHEHPITALARFPLPPMLVASSCLCLRAVVCPATYILKLKSEIHFSVIFHFLFLVLFSLFVSVPVRLLLSLFSEGKAWELASFLSSSKDKVGVVGGAARRAGGGETPSAGGGGGGVGGGVSVGATPPSAKRARNSLSR